MGHELTRGHTHTPIFWAQHPPIHRAALSSVPSLETDKKTIADADYPRQTAHSPQSTCRWHAGLTETKPAKRNRAKPLSVLVIYIHSFNPIPRESHRPSLSWKGVEEWRSSRDLGRTDRERTYRSRRTWACWRSWLPMTLRSAAGAGFRRGIWEEVRRRMEVRFLWGFQFAVVSVLCWGGDLTGARYGTQARKHRPRVLPRLPECTSCHFSPRPPASRPVPRGQRWSQENGIGSVSFFLLFLSGLIRSSSEFESV